MESAKCLQKEAGDTLETAKQEVEKMLLGSDNLYFFLFCVIIISGNRFNKYLIKKEEMWKQL